MAVQEQQQMDHPYYPLGSHRIPHPLEALQSVRCNMVVHNLDPCHMQADRIDQKVDPAGKVDASVGPLQISFAIASLLLVFASVF